MQSFAILCLIGTAIAVVRSNPTSTEVPTSTLVSGQPTGTTDGVSKSPDEIKQKIKEQVEALTEACKTQSKITGVVVKDTNEKCALGRLIRECFVKHGAKVHIFPYYLRRIVKNQKGSDRRGDESSESGKENWKREYVIFSRDFLPRSLQQLKIMLLQHLQLLGTWLLQHLQLLGIWLLQHLPLIQMLQQL
ncbi:unnamed protein product [Nesidiocoris tenuis]|uniref:Uncharacterized protein n=1 Tax=Nesidiocoris tenuis TaxID=355587 RepID=A0A6H5H3R5_9HEMI|nr:unnamed protein product [Nesidiocoris tenuis]